jgi:hypothetical protein
MRYKGCGPRRRLMYIAQGHFLSPFVVVLKDGRPIDRLMSIDTDLMVGTRLVGYDSNDGLPIIDLVVVDKVAFVIKDMPEDLLDIIPLEFERLQERPSREGE